MCILPVQDLEDPVAALALHLGVAGSHGSNEHVVRDVGILLTSVCMEGLY